MSGRYMIEVKQDLITSTMIEADNQREAIENVVRQEGSAGDIHPGETEVISIKRMDG